jgi:hypothetical protein
MGITTALGGEAFSEAGQGGKIVSWIQHCLDLLILYMELYKSLWDSTTLTMIIYQIVHLQPSQLFRNKVICLRISFLKEIRESRVLVKVLLALYNMSIQSPHQTQHASIHYADQ